MTPLSAFGLLAVTAMLVTYALEKRSHWFILGFALSCGLGSAYGFLQGAWPFGIVEAVWMLVAVHRWWGESKKRLHHFATDRDEMRLSADKPGQGDAL